MKITEAQKRIAIKALTMGQTQKQAAKAAGISQQSISKDKSYMVESSCVKKEIQEKLKKELVDDLSDVVKGMDRVIRDVLGCLTKDVIAKASPAALATIAGIMTDKRQILTGGVADNPHTDYADKQHALAYLQGVETNGISITGDNISITLPVNNRSEAKLNKNVETAENTNSQHNERYRNINKEVIEK